MLGLFVFCFFYYCLGGIAVELGYHRCLTHKAFKLKNWFEYSIIFLGLPAGTPIQWVGTHRKHHAFADLINDPHSPIIHGFWFAHNGWYINTKNPILCLLYALAGPMRFLIDAWNRPISNQQYNQHASDISEIPFYAFISKTSNYRISMLFHLLVPFGIAFYVWGLAGFVSLWITLTIIYNLGDGVNSMAHQNTASSTTVNSQFWAIVTFGVALHESHHKNPNLANLAETKTPVDVGWVIIRTLKLFNLATDIQTVK